MFNNMNLLAPTPIEKLNMYKNALKEINSDGRFVIGGLCYFISKLLGHAPGNDMYSEYIPKYYPEIRKKTGSIDKYIEQSERKPFIEQQIHLHLTAIKFNFRFSQK